MENRDEFGRPLGDDLNRPYDADRTSFSDRPDNDSSLAWLGGLVAMMFIVGGLFYAFTGLSNERVATNTPPPAIERPAPVPTPAPIPPAQ